MDEGHHLENASNLPIIKRESMAIRILSETVHEKDGQKVVTMVFQNTSFMDYSEEQFYPTWEETIPYEEWERDYSDGHIEEA
jgi:hypothetical protein